MAHRDALATAATHGHHDALLRGGRPTPPREHRALRRAYMREYLQTLNAISAYARSAWA